MSALQDLVAALTFGAGERAGLACAVAALLGATGGAVGTFAVLRGRSLVTDALGHATLPGVVAAFALAGALGVDGRHPLVVMAGAAASALAALGVLALLRGRLGVDEDPATGTVLAGSFGLGLVLLSLLEGLRVPDASGLDHVLFGQVATARAADLVWLAAVGALAALALAVLRRPLAVLCFDEDFAARSGLRTRAVDGVLFALLFAVTVAALPVVGAVLVVALVVLPAAAARQWTDRLHRLVPLAGVIGAGSAHLGASASYAFPSAPAGAVVVLVAGAVFGSSVLLAPRRGLLARRARRARALAAAHRRALVDELGRRGGLSATALGPHERRLLDPLVRAGTVRLEDGRYLSPEGGAR